MTKKGFLELIWLQSVTSERSDVLHNVENGMFSGYFILHAVWRQTMAQADNEHIVNIYLNCFSKLRLHMENHEQKIP